MHTSGLFRRSNARLMLLFLLSLAYSFSTFLKGEIPRPEHPKPQFMREKWVNLNGKWSFAIDHGKSGIDRKWYEDPSGFDETITVPFCPESQLSGIHNRDFMEMVWYHRTFEIPRQWQGQRIFLNFGGVDYDCRAWVNGNLVGRHYGGSVSFVFEITHALRSGTNDLVVCAVDDIRSGAQPAGKQSNRDYFNQGCCKYNRVTGIWQTVWLEARGQSYLDEVRIIPDVDNSRFVLVPVIAGNNRGLSVKATLLTNDKKKKIASVHTGSHSGIPIFLNIKKPRLWSPSDPFLYDLIFELYDGNQVIDRVESYAGLRKFHIEDNRFYLNGEPIFLRFVLDQGFYPEGIWTAPTDRALKADIELSLDVGFNGARLHQKVFEERFHYWADKLGYLTWGEFTDWGATFENPQSLINLKREWREIVLRDLNHPSIIAWTPFNETASRARKNPEIHRRFVHDFYKLTKTLDPTRPVNDASGYVHIKTDIFTIHDYDQNTAAFEKRYATVDPANEDIFIGYERQAVDLSVDYQGQPYVVDEYGGTFWIPEYEKSEPRGKGRARWGYGKNAKEVEDLIEKLTETLLGNPNISGFTYTQLTDIDQEVNGIYTFDRIAKFNVARLGNIFGGPAAVEQIKK